MPSVAPNSRIKRILSSSAHQQVNDPSTQKRERVRFDDHVRVICPEEEISDSMVIESIEDDGDLDFSLSIGDDGEIDYVIYANDNDEKQCNITSIDRPMSPIEGCEHFLSDGFCSDSSELDQELMQNTTINDIGPSLKISIDACNRAPLPDIAPLITPPASPKRVHTVSKYGEEEEATICEWPSNLAVDIAMTIASMNQVS